MSTSMEWLRVRNKQSTRDRLSRDRLRELRRMILMVLTRVNPRSLRKLTRMRISRQRKVREKNKSKLRREMLIEFCTRETSTFSWPQSLRMLSITNRSRTLNLSDSCWSRNSSSSSISSLERWRPRRTSSISLSGINSLSPKISRIFLPISKRNMTSSACTSSRCTRDSRQAQKSRTRNSMKIPRLHSPTTWTKTLMLF